MTNQWSVSGNFTDAVRAAKPAIKSSESSTIGIGSTVKGIVTFAGPVRVDGVVEGDLVCTSEVSVGEAGKVKANIRAESVKVFGTILGDISAESLIELYAGAKVIGNLKAARVAIHDGVDFQGHCKMSAELNSAERKMSAELNSAERKMSAEGRLAERSQNVVQLETALPKERI